MLTRSNIFADYKFHFVIAANVLHATRDLRQTLKNVQQLMAPGGILMLLVLITTIVCLMSVIAF